ncbi:Transposase [Microcystis aeruginosa]
MQEAKVGVNNQSLIARFSITTYYILLILILKFVLLGSRKIHLQ